MRLGLALLVLGAFSASCTAGPGGGALSVGDVSPHLAAWDGETVLVRGWIRGCHHGFQCTIDPGPRGDAKHERFLILDHVPALEDRLGAADGREVILRAKVTDICVVNICTDRAPALVPIAVTKVY